MGRSFDGRREWRFSDHIARRIAVGDRPDKQAVKRSTENVKRPKFFEFPEWL